MDQTLIKYLHSNLFEEVGIGDLSDDKKKQILGDLAEILEQRVFLRLVERIPVKERKAVITLLGDTNATDEEKMKSVQVYIPDFDAFLQTEIALFKKELSDAVHEDIAADLIAAE